MHRFLDHTWNTWFEFGTPLEHILSCRLTLLGTHGTHGTLHFENNPEEQRSGRAAGMMGLTAIAGEYIEIMRSMRPEVM